MVEHYKIDGAGPITQRQQDACLAELIVVQGVFGQGWIGQARTLAQDVPDLLQLVVVQDQAVPHLQSRLQLRRKKV